MSDLADATLSTSSRRSWITGSFRQPDDFFRRHSVNRDDDEVNLKWAALEKLPTYSRMRKGILVKDDVICEVDICKLGINERKLLVENIFKVVEEDNEQFLRRLKSRIDQVGLELPKIEVRFEDLTVEADAYVGSRALPTLLNSTLNIVEEVFGLVVLSQSKKRVNKILKGVSGILKPSRMTLLLGPPASGKTTLLLALAGKLDKDLRASGRVTYCGHELSEFVPQRTCAYISQHDLHNPEMTVRETVDFSGWCLGVGMRYEMLSELSRREKDANIKPDPQIDAFMKATAIEGQKTSLATDYILKVLGLDICADIIIGDDMRRGISGGQKKRVTTGEMLAGPARALFMDEISTGLDSSTTFQIVKFLRQMVHVMDGTAMISLLQPAPETFELFDDVVLLSEGEIVYHGPRETILEFFEFMGFRCPERKGVADFLQEVTSKKDQEQYWFKADEPYHYVSIIDFAQKFELFYIGRQLSDEIKFPFDKSITHPAALAKKKYGMSHWELFKACLSREWLLMQRNSFVYIFKTTQITVMSLICMTVFLRTEMNHKTIADGYKYMGPLFYGLVNMMFNGTAEMAMTVYTLPVYYKQREFLFFPPWAFGLSYCIPKVPISVLESGIWIIITYYTVGFAPAASRFFKQLLAFVSIHQMALSLFRLVGAVGRTMVLSYTIGNFSLLVLFVLGGFVISKDYIQPWWEWAYWASPMMYGQNAIAINEFLDPRWNTPNNDSSIDAPTVGKAILKSRGMFVDESWYWICIGALVGFSFLFNACFILALTYMESLGSSQHVLIKMDAELKNENQSFTKDNDVEAKRKISKVETVNANDSSKKGMVLPFQPLSLAFHHVNYYVDMPAELKSHGVKDNRLQLLSDVSGSFRPGQLTALVGVSGAGKTTLMDVLAGRKTGGYIEGSISISGYPKKQDTFARVSGYCEQSDVHSPNVTVYESLVYSAWLRLSPDVDMNVKMMFIEEIMELVELNLLRDALVGLPGINGLTTEQRKRLTIAVELVANPSIIFIDEPTSGLDARTAAIVMRTVRNTVNTGRTVVCTIHQPSIDIFEAFDELLLMKSGGQVIYAGALGHHSCKLIEYFEEIPGVPKISEGYNPATWVLDISSSSAETCLNVNFADIYLKSSLYQKNDELIKELSLPAHGSEDLYFPTKYSQNFVTQCIACFWKQNWSYWRNPQYNSVRFVSTLVYGLLFGTLFWNMGEKMGTQQELFNSLGAVYASVFFLGGTCTMSVQPVVAVGRTVFYRERAAGMYSSLSYAFAQVSIEVVYIAVQSILYTLILFPMIGFTWQADKFFWFLYFIFMCCIYFTLYGMMAVALTPNHQTSGIISSFFFGMWNLFAGFIVAKPLIPIWWRWYYWVTPLAWTIQGIVVSQIGDKVDLVKIPGQSSIPVNQFLKQTLGFERSFLGYAAAAHVGFVLVFVFVFAFSIKHRNFQNR